MDLLEESKAVHRAWQTATESACLMIDHVIQNMALHTELDGKALLANLMAVWREAHNSASKLGKNIDKKMKSEVLSRMEFGTQTAENTAIINECIQQHFCHLGKFEISDCLGEESKQTGRESSHACKAPFREMHSLLEHMAAEDVLPATHSTPRWLARYISSVPRLGPKLEFDLYRLHYIKLLREDVAQALGFAKANFARFLDLFGPDVEKAMGCLAFYAQLEQSPYAHLLDHKEWTRVSQDLVTAYCTVTNLPLQSSLQLCSDVGWKALSKIARVSSIMHGKKAFEWNPKDELPVEIDLSRDQWFHSVFTCPVLRQPTTEENPPMLLPCGHVICREALSRLCKGNNFVRFKCPYCPAEISFSQAQRIRF